MNKKIRTRYAPSPTGFMHIGNLRTALYEYLIAKSHLGQFILRIEDTDQSRLVQGATQKIYDTLRETGLIHDEGPDIGGKFGPYIQSQRQKIYKPFAEELVKKGKAYYCFCTKERMETLKNQQKNEFSGYDRHCRDLSESEIKKLLQENTPYVIRQKMPLTGNTVFTDLVFNEVSTSNDELEDQILIKADGYPTYNFANVIDDHLMNITHVVRGCEYLSSTPKYNLLYQAFGWDVPEYIHLPLIMGKDQDGKIAKLSKRHGATSFEDLIKDGYLADAIINYIALLGWCPKENREIFDLDELTQIFSIDGLSKSPSIFDYDKLTWFNGEYLRKKSLDQFEKICLPYFKEAGVENFDTKKIAALLHQRVTKLTQIQSMVDFFVKVSEYDVDEFINKKSKSTLEISKKVISDVIPEFQSTDFWNFDTIHELLLNLAKKLELKNSTVMWPIRIAVSGRRVTPGGVVEILEILGKEESIKRIQDAIKKLT